MNRADLLMRVHELDQKYTPFKAGQGINFAKLAGMSVEEGLQFARESLEETRVWEPAKSMAESGKKLYERSKRRLAFAVFAYVKEFGEDDMPLGEDDFEETVEIVNETGGLYDGLGFSLDCFAEELMEGIEGVDETARELFDTEPEPSVVLESSHCGSPERSL